MKYKIENLNLYIYRLYLVLIATLSITFLWKDTFLVSAVLLVCAVLMNLKASNSEKISYVVVAILATLLEALANSGGAWSYSNPHILNFPIWLPIYWGMGGIVMKDVFDFIKQLSQ